MGAFTPPLYPSTGGASLTAMNGIFGGVGGVAISNPLLPAANVVFYAPVSLQYRIRIKNLWWINGSGLAGNVEVGLYSSSSGKRLVTSGSTVQAGSGNRQTVTLGSSLELMPGRYYFAFVGSSTSASFGAWNGIAVSTLRRFGFCEESSASLPATMTPVQAATAWQMYQGADLS